MEAPGEEIMERRKGIGWRRKEKEGGPGCPREQRKTSPEVQEKKEYLLWHGRKKGESQLKKKEKKILLLIGMPLLC